MKEKTARSPFDEAAHQAVEVGNRIADGNEEADLWEIADGLLAGAIQFWLYSRQPCGDAFCEDCGALSTADLRMKELQRLSEEFAQESEYYHSPADTNVGRA